MVDFQYESLTFHTMGENVRVIFKRNFYFILLDEELQDIGPWRVVDAHTLQIDGKESLVSRKFQRLFDSKLENEMYSLIGGQRAVYVWRGPLLGSQRFGIIDQDSNAIEIRPLSGCNLNCVYCSVDEGIKVKKVNYYVSPDLMAQELTKVVAAKKEDVIIFISAQGEVTLYPDLIELVSKVRAIPGVSVVTIISNGVLLTKDLLDTLIDAGMNRLNISINAATSEKAKKIAGVPSYNLEKIKAITAYAATKIDVIVAPTYIPGMNDDDMVPIAQFAKSIGAVCGIQNFLNYREGRNPVKELGWDDFFAKMKQWEKESGVSLLEVDYGFSINENKAMKKPFRKGDVIEVEKLYHGYGVAKDRLVSIPFSAHQQRLKVKLLRDKYNIFVGKPM